MPATRSGHSGLPSARYSAVGGSGDPFGGTNFDHHRVRDRTCSNARFNPSITASRSIAMVLEHGNSCEL